jgi:16S rRNA (uracil1498-N3)-methyltransferase
MAPRVRVFVDGIELGVGRRTLDEASSHHLVRVLRLDKGSRIVVFDGFGNEQDATMDELARTKRSLRVTIALEGEPRRGVVADRASVTVIQGLAKGDKLERVVRSCAELGARAVVVVRCERSVVKLDRARAAAQQAHLRAVSASASEQCGRADVMDVLVDVPLLEALRLATSAGRGCIADEAGGQRARAWIECGERKPLAVLVGPEGGLSDEERALARACGFESISLGPRILRTEHAGAAFVAMASALVGDGSG